MKGLCSGMDWMNKCVPWSYLDRSTQQNQFQQDRKRTNFSPLSGFKGLVMSDDFGSGSDARSRRAGRVTQFE